MISQRQFTDALTFVRTYKDALECTEYVPCCSLNVVIGKSQRDVPPTPTTRHSPGSSWMACKITR